MAVAEQAVAGEYSRLGINDVYCGDCLAFLKSIPDNSVDVVITSPPYFRQRKYTGVGVGMEHSVANYLEALVESFTEMMRAIKPTGSIIYNLGDKIDGKLGTLLIPYQFALLARQRNPELSLLNHITWVKTNPTPRQFTRRLVSCHEPFFHFVKSANYYYYPEEFMSAPRQQELFPANNPGKGYFKKLMSPTSPQQKKNQPPET